MVARVFVANRGEIAVRVMRAAREIGIESVGAMARGDEDAGHLHFATFVQALEGDDPRAAFLDARGLVDAAVQSGADALHPGYGFLSESPQFATLVEAAGITFIGPRPDTMETFGVKTVARRFAREAGVPTVPGTEEPVASPEAALEVAKELGFPVALKASYGGGGRGIRTVRDGESVAAAFESARREATQAFGRSEVYLEKLLQDPRHVEVQVVGDGKGGAVHFFERDCSMQRRNQKLIEESPAPNLDTALRQRLVDDAVRLASAGKYRSAGTVEFLIEGDTHYFLEVNARLQVEHPVSECVTGWDLVRLTVELAGGQRELPAQEEIRTHGHAIECRVNAEDARQGFVPTPGKITRWVVPHGPGVRVDSAASAGGSVSPHFDSLLAKLIVHAASRPQARARMLRAIGEFSVGGVQTTLPFHRFAVASEPFGAGRYTTATVSELGVPPGPPQEDRHVAAAAAVLARAMGGGVSRDRAGSQRRPGTRRPRHPATRGGFAPAGAGWFHEL